MSSAIYQCPSCEEEFIAPTSRRGSRLICPHCSRSDSIGSFRAIERDSSEGKLSRLPEERTGSSHRSRRSQAPAEPLPGLHPALEKLLEQTKLPPEAPALPSSPLPRRAEPFVPKLTATPVSSTLESGQDDPPSLSAAAPDQPLAPPLAQNPAQNQRPAPGKAVASAVDADFEIILVHPRLSEIGGRSWVQSDALLALEPWEDMAAAPPNSRWSRIALFVLAGFLLLAVAIAALLLALRA